ncbi:MAG: magnesium transporter [Acholeplasmataceae bacterium]|nr:magnesium transporter [Acholeplasmataceae bacterium]
MKDPQIIISDNHILSSDLHGHDLMEAFGDLEPSLKETFCKKATDDRLADLIAYLEPEEATSVLSLFDLDRQRSILERMEPDDAVLVIREFEDDEQETILDGLEKTSDLLSLATYDADETGAAMTPLILTFQPEDDVKLVTKTVIRKAPEVESVNTLFVTSADGRFLGAVTLTKLIRTKAPAMISSIMADMPFAYDTDLITKTVDNMRNYGIYDMPVCDEQMVLKGIITLDDALDIYQEASREDFEKLAALPETEDGKAFKVAIHRLPWLVTLMALSVPIALVTSMFEEVISTVAILILFQPLILGSAGNVATQTLAVTLKSIATDFQGKTKNAIREIITGMINGMAIALIAFLMTYLFAVLNTSLTETPFVMALIVGLSLWLTVLMAPIIASVVPLALSGLGVDPAVASGPFITTLIDISALIIYFGLATLMLGGLGL